MAVIVGNESAADIWSNTQAFKLAIINSEMQVKMLEEKIIGKKCQAKTIVPEVASCLILGRQLPVLLLIFAYVPRSEIIKNRLHNYY